MKIKLEPTFTTRKVIRNLKEANRNIRYNMKIALNKSLDFAVDRAKDWYIAGLGGGRFASKVYVMTSSRLHSRSGRLRESIGRTNARFYGGKLVADFGSGVGGKPTVPYANVHEFGYYGVQKVKGHIRTQTHAWGYFGPPFPFPVWVNPFHRLMQIKARSYLQPALDDMIKSKILEENLQVAIDAGVDGIRL